MNSQIEALINNIEKIIVGKRDVIIKVICAMLSEGHILIEDVPGVGKTRLAYALSSSVSGKFNRIQLTPDIMPSDIVGFSIIDQNTHEFEYKEGAAMCNFLLADEINRASSKTQSSLLEIMEEHQISLDGHTFSLPTPFMLMATQNPVETYGTYHLPEAQMDRFLMKISMGYPEFYEELDILNRSENMQFTQDLTAVMNTEDVKIHIENAKNIICADSIKRYIVEMLSATRNSPFTKIGASPRAGIAILRAAKSYAYINGRSYVIPDDIKTLVPCILSHRLILSSKGKSEFEDSVSVMEKISSTVAAPSF